MMLKKDKEDVLNEINSRSRDAMHNALYNAFGQGFRVDTHSVISALQSAIALGIEEGFRTLLENRYTDENFENDIGLK